MRRKCQALLVVLGLLLFALDHASAQPLIYTAESLDSFVINADRIWVARIVGVRDEPIPGGSEKPGITLAIEETLKFPLFEQRHEKLGLFVEHPTTAFKEFEKSSSRLLIAHSDCDPYSPKLIELAPGKTEVFLANFELLREPDAVVQTAKDIIGRVPSSIRQLHTFRLTLPPEALAKVESGPYGQLITPVDEQLEKLALELLDSESYIKRLEAAQALRYFKSRENIDRLRTLLEDTGHYLQTNNGEIQSKYFGVRDAAYQTLQAWGIEVERPVITEPNNQQRE